MSDIQEHETLSLVYVSRIHGTELKDIVLPCFLEPRKNKAVVEFWLC